MRDGEVTSRWGKEWTMGDTEKGSWTSRELGRHINEEASQASSARLTKSIEDLAGTAMRVKAERDELLQSLVFLLNCCELNMDDMEPDTQVAIAEARDLVDRIARGAKATGGQS